MTASTNSDRAGIAYRIDRVCAVRAARQVLTDISCELATGRVTAVIGASGSGKSSLLRLLNRLNDPVSGTVTYRGHPLASYEVRALRWRVGFVFQTPVMFPGTVGDNLREAARLAGVTKPDSVERAHRALELAELQPDLLDRNGNELSVGQRQRANLARALMSRPETLVLDEPTSALDPQTAKALLATVRRLCGDDGLTVLLATHRLAEARAVADDAVVLREGRLTECGEAAPLLAALDSHEVD